MEPLRGGAKWEVFRSLQYIFERDGGIPVSSSSSILLSGHEVSVVLHYYPKAIGQIDHELNSPKL